MAFTFQPERFDDGSGSDHWFSGIYKITKYDAYETEHIIRKEHYCAYFKPHGWVNWGNRVQAETDYPTLEKAIIACQRHAEVFANPSENDRLPKGA